jgi:predicted metal-dependent hydrolase
MPKNQRKDPTTQKRQALVDGQTIVYTLRRSFRARRVRLEISQRNGLVIILPRSYPNGQLPGLIKSKERWISRHLARLSRCQPPTAPKKLEPGDTIPYLGRNFELIKQKNHHGEEVVLQGNKLAVSSDLFDNGLLETSFEKWYRAEAARLITDMADRLSSQIGITYERIVIRGQKTRWGSCSHKKNLSFNWKLIMAPQPVVEYVIIHELLHLKEMNHSKKFWVLVSRNCPDWQEHKKWLKEHETDLTSLLCSSSEPAVPHQLRLI